MAGNLLDLSSYIKQKLSKSTKKGNTGEKPSISALSKFDEKLDELIAALSLMEFQFDPSASTKDRLIARKEFEKKRLTMALAGLTDLDKQIDGLIDAKLKKKVSQQLAAPMQHLDFLLNNCDGQISFIKHYNKDLNNIYLAAEIFAIDFVPFNQSHDPFFGKSNGNCWGHTYHWGEMIEKKKLDTRMISNAQILEDQARNCTVKDVVAKRVQFYKISDAEYENAIWDMLNRLKPTDLFSLDYKEPDGSWSFHATGIRQYGESGIEFMDSNQGIFRFATKHDFVNFYLLYLHNLNNSRKENIKYLTVFHLPYQNDPMFGYEKTKQPLCSEHGKLEAIQIYRSKIPMKKKLHPVEELILDLKESEFHGENSKNLLKDLIEKIHSEISAATQPKFFKISASKNEKFIAIQDALTKLAEQVKTLPDSNPHQQACLLFALMHESLSLVPELEEKIEVWMNQNMVDRELISSYMENQQIPSQITKKPSELTKDDEEEEKKEIVETKTISNAPGLIVKQTDR